MSDMSRPNPLPSAVDHERHDALLVAQLAAGDTLPPEQLAEAERLVSGCAACAALAADLPEISRAVAQEPVPRRRRDFRLRPEDAEQLRGSAVTRFLRRLSWPSARAFQPAAAGVLSIGLLLVVAGYAWPDGGTVSVQAEPNLVDWSAATPSSMAADVMAEEPAAPLMVQPDDEAEAALDGAARMMEESEFAESLAESQAGMAEGLAQKSAAEQDQLEPGQSQSLELGAAVDALDPTADDADAYRSSGADPQDVAALDQSPLEETATVASEVQVPVDDGRPEELVIVLGLVLALGGSGLLLLGWLARRARDPLAP